MKKAKAKPTAKRNPATEIYQELAKVNADIKALWEHIDRLDKELKTKLAPMGISIDD